MPWPLGPVIIRMFVMTHCDNDTLKNLTPCLVTMKGRLRLMQRLLTNVADTHCWPLPRGSWQPRLIGDHLNYKRP